MNERTTLRDTLRTLVPRGWQIIETDRQIDAVKTVAVLISQRRIEPAPANPLGGHKVTFRVYVATAHKASDVAEDALDEAVDTLLYAIDSIDPIRWTAAEKLIYQERLAYEITVEALSERTTE